jgi:putative membrane protein
MRSSLLLGTLIITAVLPLGQLIHAQDTTNPPNPRQDSVPARPAVKTMSDKQFAREAVAGGLSEVKLGQLALDRGNSDAVKKFGQKMVDDHTKANSELQAAATKSNITLPTEVKPADQATYDRLLKMNGAAFDRAYARDMVQDHIHDVAAFKQEANYGKDPSIKAFASATLPTLVEHLKMARDVKQAVSGTAKASAAGQ